MKILEYSIRKDFHLNKNRNVSMVLISHLAMDREFVLVNFLHGITSVNIFYFKYKLLYIFCFIGKRFAELEMKLALVEILTKFEVEPCERTEVPLKFSKKSLVTLPENGIWLRFKKINS